MPRLALFPLPVVLFPGATMPLHVFEPRYRRLLADCAADDGRFGLIHLPAGTAEPELAPGSVGCVAHVVSSELLPDGRSNIVVRGGERFVFRGYATDPAPYRVGEVDGFADEAEAPDPALERTVRAAFLRVAVAARALADDPAPPPELPADAAALSFAIAALVELPADGRVRLLASRSPNERLRILDAVLVPAAPAVEARAAVHARAKTNGHGPHPHEVPGDG